MVELFGLNMKNPKINHLKDKFLSNEILSEEDILEARAEFFSISSRKAAYLLKLRPSWSQWLLLQEYKLLTKLSRWLYSFSFIRRLIISYEVSRYFYPFLIVVRDLNYYSLILGAFDSIENNLLEKGIKIERENYLNG